MAIEERIVFPAVLNALRQKTGQISLCKWPTATARFLSRTLKRNSAPSGETSWRWKRKRRRSGLTEDDDGALGISQVVWQFGAWALQAIR